MASFIATALTALTALASSAAPAAGHRGSITYYAPGLGACGKTNGEGELIAAVSAAIYDSTRPCGRSIRVDYDGRSTVVRVVDRCAGCAADDLDLSPAAFRAAIGDLSLGCATATWDWV